MKRYNLVVCGGTFDHFHKGHRKFLFHALSVSNKLLVGLTTGKYIKNSKLKTQNSKLIEDYNTRKENILSFFKQEKALGRIEIQPIDDIYIPKPWEPLPIEAIIVTKDTILGAEKINSKRKEQGKYPLRIEVYPLVKSGKNGYISSSRIRGGEINREGRSYINPIWLKQKLFLTDRLRQELKKPFGSVLVSNVILANEVRPESPTAIRDAGLASMVHPYIITVGDVTTKTFNKLYLGQNISVIDFKVARKKEFSNISELGFSGKERVVKVVNSAGCLTPAIFKAVLRIFTFGHSGNPSADAASRISKLIRDSGLARMTGLKQDLKNDVRPMILLIDGEEDLAVLPFTLATPLGSLIFYGQPGEGIVKVEVSEEKKMRAYYLVSSFEVGMRWS